MFGRRSVIKRIKEGNIGLYFLEALYGPHKGWKYIGKSWDIYARRYTHFLQLSKNQHCNKKLQSYYNKYGKDSLKFTHFMKCTKQELNYWEIFFIKYYDSIKNGFNMTEGGDMPLIKTKGGCLKNLTTNQIVEFNCIKDFELEYNVSQISLLLNGKIKRAGEWYNHLIDAKPKSYHFVNPDGKEFKTFEMMSFSKENGLSSASLWQLVNRKIYYTCRGWRLATDETIGKPFTKEDGENPNSKKCILRNIETGEIITCGSQSEFIRKYNISEDSITKLMYGRIKKAKCWENPNPPFITKGRSR